MDYTEKLVKHINGYHGLITETNLDCVLLTNGQQVYREVVEHPGGVAVIPVDENGDVYCVRQFRYPFSEHLLEVPAGKLEPEEDPLECAIRELSEETGLTADEFINLGSIYPSPGFCREILHIYLATGLHSGQSHPDSDEFLDVEKLNIDRLYEMIMRNEIADAKTIIAVLKARETLRLS